MWGMRPIDALRSRRQQLPREETWLFYYVRRAVICAVKKRSSCSIGVGFITEQTLRKTSNFYGPLPGLATRASTGGLGRSAKAQAAGQLLLIAVFGVMFREPADIDCCCLLRRNIG